ncbi:sensor histidine kinase [Methanocalculus sp.]|uniref:sensor histidine kinase n=1 Tax=Methanocalculus sp. TaxID=2004547 RepID=UPI0027245C33|nr:sensor histidine kinase [Methanocalculus sp.]MDO8842452.1 sensor histidine kinase [Methanocalculus sp.]
MNNDIFIQAFLSSPEGMLLIEKGKGSIIAMNKSLSEILGSPEGVDLSLPIHEVFPISDESSSLCVLLEQKVYDTIVEERDGFILQIPDTSGCSTNLLLRPRQFCLNGRDYILIMVSKASGEVEANLRMKDALAEKEVLLREVHHRVKNNLQVISSLLNLQSQFVDDSRIVGYMTDSQNRVRALGYVYEHLYRSKEVGRIDFSEYTTRITQSLLREYSSFAQRVHIKYDVRDVTLNPDTSIPLGLLLNELISNALRHAFPNGREGAINISMRPNDDRSYTLIISDDGVGLPPDMEFDRVESLGLLLVSSLVSQLDGTIELKRDRGTEFKITFKALQYKERR